MTSPLARSIPSMTAVASPDRSSIMPPSISDRTRRQGDEQFITVTGRRPAIEYAVARAAERTVPVVRGVSAAELLTGRPVAAGIPHIAGVRTTDGQALAADLVIDAMGRRSKVADWLEAAGAPRPIEDAAESGFIYYTRYFRSATGGVPPCRAGLLTHFHSFSLLTPPGDSQTWSVTVFIFSGDPALKALRDPKSWRALVAACPLHAHWLDGEPITDVLAMGGVTDRYRRFVLDGAPVATGILSVGDAWGCTNPVNGRGITIGLMHAVGTVDVVRAHIDDPLALALAHDAMTEMRVTPWYQNTVAFDRKRAAQINAVIQGRDAPHPPDPADALFTAMLYDADVFRAAIEIFAMLALPQEVMARPGVAGRVMELARAHGPVMPPGPSRHELLRMLA